MYKSDEIRCRVGQCLRAARRRAGLTLELASESIGMSSKTLSRIEKGSASITADVLVLYAKKLGTTAASIIAQIDCQ